MVERAEATAHRDTATVDLLNESAAVRSELDYNQPAHRWRRTYVLGLLTATYAFNMVDRSLLTILQGPIEAEFNLSDTQLGLLTGFAFAAFYSVSSLFIATFADIGVRRTVLAVAIAGWSLCTSACGLVGGFGTLFLSRVGVGIAESGSVPTSQSMISDMYPVEARGSAIGITSCGIFIGQFIGLAFGAWLGAKIGWRATFISIGLVGVLFALTVRLTIAEPLRQPPKAEDGQTLWQLLRTLGRSPVFVPLMAGSALSSMSGIGSFMPLFMMRSHDLTLAQAGLWLGIVSGVAGALGATIGGRATDLLARRNLYRLPLVPAVMLCVAAPFLVVALRVSSPVIMMVAYFFPALTIAGHIPPTIIISHSLAPPQSRARASALVMLLLNLIGATLSTLFIGMLSDHLRPRLGVAALGTAMTTVFVCAVVLSACLFLLASRNLCKAGE